MSDDFVQFNLDRPPKADVKSNEQMHCHSVGKAEDYPPLEKSVFILMIGEEIQKLSVIQNIPELIKEDYEGCLSKIIPKMNQGLVQGSIEYHLAASKSVQKILKQNTIQPVHFKVNFLKTVLKSMDNRDPDTAKTWLDTLLEAIKILKEDVIIEDILPVAEAKSRHTEPVFHRVMSCRMLGRIAEYCSTYTVQKSVLGVVQALCQDVDKTVRASMCLELPQLTRPLLSSYERDLLPLLNDSVNDEQTQVRAAAYCALVQSLPLVGQDILKQSFLPMAKKIIEQCLQSVQDGIFLMDLTEQFGNLCLGLEQSVKTPSMERGTFYLHAQSRSPHNSSMFVDSRVHCALNMPAIIRFCRGIGNSNAAYFTRNIYPLMCMLCADSQYAVRRAIASVMHEIAATLGKSNGFILKEFIKLLNDDSEDVLQALIPNIRKCLESFSESENFSPEVVDDKSIELTRSLFTCESEVLATYNWRLQTEFFKQLEVLMRCLPSSFIYSQFVQLLRKRLFTYRTVECRVAIVRTLLVFLRYNTNMSQRNDLRNSIIADMCCSKNFYNRSIYVRSIPYILEIFSSSYFRTHFFIPTIALMEDKVANIRFMMCDLMPTLKCIAAHDKNNGKFSVLVDAAIEKTKNERDKLVLEHIATMNKMIDKVKLDEKDSTKLKEEKLLDAIAANAKDIKSHFANLKSPCCTSAESSENF
ncbi:serine/threonine-protein phosphatase 4 regulatory subunit 4 [Nilaparvata lugens]|uniref:serine/threonine-protein phosphatase 4 regulatory subunit 4 n=1 Tax=Nilaparvata lugens TaxID=108931 RepID=UPI00193D4371|nr:serine/threonine-protein phosphatase 4 regulatory subunit 4 [Nilaparvata lugens]